MMEPVVGARYKRILGERILGGIVFECVSFERGIVTLVAVEARTKVLVGLKTFREKWEQVKG